MSPQERGNWKGFKDENERFKDEYFEEYKDTISQEGKHFENL